MAHSPLHLTLCATASLLTSSCSLLFENKEEAPFDSRPYKTIAISSSPDYIKYTAAKTLKSKGYKTLLTWNEQDKPDAYLSLKKEKSIAITTYDDRSRRYSLVDAQLRSSNGSVIWENKGECVPDDFESWAVKSSMRRAAVKAIAEIPHYGDHP